MKVLIVNTSEIKGGAARAANRLHKALLAENIDSHMLVLNKSTDDYRVHTVDQSNFEKIFGIFRGIPDILKVRRYKNRSKTQFSPAKPILTKTIDTINKLRPDVVHLQWICGGLTRVEDLDRIESPIVWTLHDMWAFTGGCHYTENCERYKKSCGKCKVLGSQKQNDLSRKVFRRKRKVFKKMAEMRIVGVSKWLAECSKSSVLLGNNWTTSIPNPINTKVYQPRDTLECRKLWGLPTEKKMVLFGAIGGSRDIRKGYMEMVDALSKLKGDHIELVIFGSSEPEQPWNSGFKTHYMGHINDDISLVTLYSAADVMVVPSLQEAFGQTASEAMSCGTPVVAFGATGLLDIIDHMKNGYLAKPYETEDLAKGIKWVLNHESYKILSTKARDKVVENFDYSVVARSYIELYKEVLKS